MQKVEGLKWNRVIKIINIDLIRNNSLRENGKTYKIGKIDWLRNWR